MRQVEPWMGDVVRELHMHGLTQKDLAREMGVTHNYLSMILCGRHTAGTQTRERVESALSRLTSA